MNFHMKRVFMMALVVGLLCNTLLSGAINATQVEKSNSDDINTTDTGLLDPIEKGEILSFTDNQKPDIDIFNLHIRMQIPMNSDENTVMIQLPQGIKVNKEPRSHLLTGFKSISNNDGSTSVSLTLANTEDEIVLTELDMEISQGGAMDNSGVVPYMLYMNFATYEGIVASASKEYTASLPIDKDIIAILGQSINTFNSFPVKQGDADVLLSQLEYRPTNKKLPTYEYSFDYTKNVVVQSESKPFTSLFQIHKVVFNKDVLANSFHEQSFTFFYTTNKNSTETIVDMMRMDSIVLSKEEYITSYRLTSLGSDNLHSTSEATTLVSFYGDVLMNGSDKTEIIKQKGFIKLPNEQDEFDFSGNNVFTAVHVIISPYSQVVVDDILSVKRDEIFPGQTKGATITFNNNITDKVTYKYIETQQTRILFTALRNSDPRLGDVQIQYATKDNPEVVDKLLKAGEALVLENEDYFTSLKFTRENFGIPESSLNLDVKLPLNQTPDINITIKSTPIFEVVDTLNAIGNVKIEILLLKAFNEVQQSAGLYYNEENKVTDILCGDKSLCNLEADSIVKLPLIFHVEGAVEGVAEVDQDVVVNPTFYIEIPDDFEFHSMVFTDSLINKKPDVSTFSNVDSNGKKKGYAKIQFYGEPASETGFLSSSLNSGIAVQFKVKKTIKQNYPFTTEKLDTLVDNRESLKRYKSNDKKIKSSIYEVDAQVGKRTYKYRSLPFLNSSTGSTGFNIPMDQGATENKLRYSIKALNDVNVETTVNKEGSLVTSNEVSIRSEEKFEGNVSILNGTNDDMVNFVMYIPIPQGSNTEKDKWGVKLAKLGAGTESDFDIYVSTNQNATKNELSSATGNDQDYTPIGEYTDDISDIKMVKLKVKKLRGGTSLNLKGLFTNKKVQTKIIGNQDGLRNEIEIDFAYNLKGMPDRVQEQKIIYTNLVDTIIKGTVFVDANQNGGMDVGEQGQVKTAVKLSLKDKPSEIIDTKEDGSYLFTVPSISAVDYVSVPYIDGYRLIKKENSSIEARERSYFNEDKKANPTLANAEYLNAGYLELNTPDWYVDIPKYVKLEDKEGEFAEEDIKIELQGVSSDDKTFPGIEIYTNTAVMLTSPDSSDIFTTKVYDKKDNLHENENKPITTLRNENNKYTITLKTKKDSRKEGVIYEGVLKFRFRFKE